jgi:hypothetical protein
VPRKASKRIGRPIVDEADRRDSLVRVLTTKAEHKELQEAAASVAMSISSWVRSLALERARAMAKRTKRTKAVSAHPL